MERTSANAEKRYHISFEEIYDQAGQATVGHLLVIDERLSPLDLRLYLLLQYYARAGVQPSLDEIASNLINYGSAVSRATVTRAMDRLREVGLIRRGRDTRTRFGGTSATYLRSPIRHYVPALLEDETAGLAHARATALADPNQAIEVAPEVQAALNQLQERFGVTTRAGEDLARWAGGRVALLPPWVTFLARHDIHVDDAAAWLRHALGSNAQPPTLDADADTALACAAWAMTMPGHELDTSALDAFHEALADHGPEAVTAYVERQGHTLIQQHPDAAPAEIASLIGQRIAVWDTPDAADDDGNLDAMIGAFQRTYGHPPNDTVRDLLARYIRDYPYPDLWMQGFDRAAAATGANGPANLNYVKTCVINARPKSTSDATPTEQALTAPLPPPT